MADRLVVEPCARADHAGWLELRKALWPCCSVAEHVREMASLIADPLRYAQFIACSMPARAPVGLAQASMRSDEARGNRSSPVVFLDAIHVAPHARRLGAGAALIAAVVHWARSAGCTELVSAALLADEQSHVLYRDLGFVETERVAYYRKTIA